MFDHYLIVLQEPPRGHPDCLTGKTFVFTGVLDSLKREEAADFVKRHGGKVRPALGCHQRAAEDYVG